MPPSPARRSSPGRELRGDNHKRGRSLEPRILVRERDDDLALFNEMQTRERESFLLKSNDDFEDTFSTRLRYFSDPKLGISIPARGESTDLLNADGEKNDYDWLLTPPDTPLFPSLDDEARPVTLIQRGRPRNQPIAISRSSTMEKGRRSSRGSASPNRLSSSPRSGGSPSQTGGRPSSAPHSNPTPSLRPATPSRGPSPQPSKPSTATTRRMSTGSSAISSSRARGTSPLPTSRGTSPLPTSRGTSPVPTSRGNSASPKISAWQTNIPGFSSEAPPNLRTSLADRPASYVRGSSPASRNGRDLSSRSSRQSMSPTPSRSSGRQSMSPTPRSISSSHSHDRDVMSSHGKVSVASSGDDDVESLQSVSMGSTGRVASRRVGAFPSNKSPASSKKPNKVMLSSSAPKRSFDSALRQMDHRKSPQNMFRPLLSSVPSSSFYVGKASAAHRAMISRNSSVTTSSNASSDQGTSGAHDTEGSDHNPDNMTPEWGRTPYLDVQDEVFSFDKADALTEDISHGAHNQSPDVQHDKFSGGARIESQLGGSENLNTHITAGAITAPSKESELLEVKGNFPEVDYVEDMSICYKCGRMYHAVELTEGDLKLCSDCRSSDEPLTTTTPEPNMVVSDNSPSLSTRIPGRDKSFDNMNPIIVIPESLEATNMAEPSVTHHEENFREQPGVDLASEKSLVQTLEEEDMSRQENLEVIGQPIVEYNSTDSNPGSQQMQRLSNHPNSELDVSEGHGISVLLMRSSSVKGPVLRGRTFSAASIPYDDPSYVRDSATSMRSSHGHGSVSASSSVDLGSARLIETRVQRQLTSRKTETVTNPKHQRTGSSLSGTSSRAFQGLGLGKSMHEEKMEVDVAHVENEVVNVTHAAIQEQLVVSLSGGADDTCAEVERDNFCGTMTAASELSTHALNTHSRESSVASIANVENSGSCGKGEEFPNELRSISDQEASALTPESCTVEEDRAQIKRSVEEKPNSIVDKGDVSDVPTQSLQDILSDIEIDNDRLDSISSQSDVVSTDSENTMDELLDSWHVEEHGSDAHGILEESAVTVAEVTVEGQGGTMTRSSSVDEAEDTLLFCSTIIENLAYEAAILAMEKENTVPMEDSRPMVTILGNSNSELNDRRGRSNGKRTSKSQKVRQKRVETKTKLSADENENAEQVDVSTTRIVGAPKRGDTMNPPKIESKCNCTVM
ncbi:hypothetical protein RHMOL_Rhmol12G0034300 [Rhododendron molle]|uniref:Uncharacterized protein n=4 Tax=Rhododendron molle TaxID=49168 RepID=A0ACC0LES7_RHOML|nr:hypothetical protein RHMOL_Rhmol12G0034300 [Rhododendron molle]KAI8526894.1 hypothetical protein RHMOL_Rhmol12G0034300 [Rhododendron molle]KAI8526895.1 hypothetical protein RHMOL_Rhmol12G0034300 [Rhododendron molle]KAI8526896.1 hypothetical protein RHMOL_Rhmol12G0034300 [Rhododendron molle]